MEPRVLRKDEVLFREGDEGTSMFEILRGRVGIYSGYGTAEEKLLTELGAGSSFGEMAMIEAQPRSAAAVALEEGTRVECVTWETLGAYFRERPAKVVVIMQQMSRRIRELTADYLGACKAITELTERAKQEKKQEEAAWMQNRLRRYLDAYQSCGGNR